MDAGVPAFYIKSDRSPLASLPVRCDVDGHVERVERRLAADQVGGVAVSWLPDRGEVK
jgi:hypothetical protein